MESNFKLSCTSVAQVILQEPHSFNLVCFSLRQDVSKKVRSLIATANVGNSPSLAIRSTILLTLRFLVVDRRENAVIAFIRDRRVRTEVEALRAITRIRSRLCLAYGFKIRRRSRRRRRRCSAWCDGALGYGQLSKSQEGSSMLIPIQHTWARATAGKDRERIEEKRMAGGCCGYNVNRYSV